MRSGFGDQLEWSPSAAKLDGRAAGRDDGAIEVGAEVGRRVAWAKPGFNSKLVSPPGTQRVQLAPGHRRLCRDASVRCGTSGT